MNVLQDLYNRCEKMRPTLFRLASDTEDNDEALGEGDDDDDEDDDDVDMISKV